MASPVIPLLEVRDLSVHFRTEGQKVTAVDRISFDLAEGEVLGIVGESGSGKSTVALALMQLIATPPGSIDAERLSFKGKDLMSMSDREMRAVRGNEISMIFQEPMSSLNPVFTIGNQLVETICEHEPLTKRQAFAKAVDLLRLVGIPDPEARVTDYPHHLSGGMRQRVMIAMALACAPKLLLADEPTTALDVTIQAQVLELLQHLQGELDMAVVLITHDLGVVAEYTHRVVVMYAGRIVEEAPVADLFAAPQHPYTELLLKSMPPLDEDLHRLLAIPGSVPSPTEMPTGCRFAPRCPYAQNICRETEPAMIRESPARAAACWRLVDYKVPA
ncbi:ABC transporter ATP-binding protein [Nitratireductor pacificus]|uniref:Oligopeptide ABC transporter ATP-binding protein n=1 Tax=Nitratireductor pacificus pht-3B TaxID=391937 RepID=K2LGK9_9HYPH|nr:oligopeptide ABC transporter ATP-binding protein [Nitratireductor pacificus pht-3B]